jgi:DNA-binding response OmpR family regulator
MDGYQVCREIKQSEYADGKAPVVVMLSSRGASADKLRGGLAGCDSYLTKPLKEDELLKVLSKYDEQVQRSFRPTNLGLSGLSTQG